MQSVIILSMSESFKLNGKSPIEPSGLFSSKYSLAINLHLRKTSPLSEFHFFKCSEIIVDLGNSLDNL